MPESRQLDPAPVSLGLVGSTKLVLFGVKGERPWTNVLLIFVPITLLVHRGGDNAGASFLLSLVSLIPLAERLGFCTESLAEYTSDTFAGLINASMGNAPELIIALFALRADLIVITYKSLLGSILSNLLLVLGMSFFVGGLYHVELTHSTALTPVNSLLLLFLLGSHAIATVFARAAGASSESVLSVSRAAAVLLLLLYILFLVFQMKTHAMLFDDEEEKEEKEDDDAHLMVAESNASDVSSAVEIPSITVADSAAAGDDTAGKTTADASPDTSADNQVEFEPLSRAASPASEEEPKLSHRGSIFALAAFAALIAVLSEVLTDSIEQSAKQLHISEGFVATILTPIAGNAAEHWSAVTFAAKGRLNVSLGIAIGSSIQVGLFIVPAVTLVAWLWNKTLSYDYGVFGVVSLGLAIFLSMHATQNGRVQWILGAILLLVYILISVAYFYELDAVG
jgi:Ca2+:H+ antiporter